jgi:hypothetical protein
MTAVQFSRQEIEDLAQKLDSLSPELSPHERQVLVAIFSSASVRVASMPPARLAPPEVTVASLREQLLDAFVPDPRAGEFLIDPPIKIGPQKL